MIRMSSLKNWLEERGIKHLEVELLQKVKKMEYCGRIGSPTSSILDMVPKRMTWYVSAEFVSFDSVASPTPHHTKQKNKHD